LALQEEGRAREETRVHMGLQEWEEGSIMGGLLKKATDQQPFPPTTVVVF